MHNPQPLQSSVVNLSFFPWWCRSILRAPVGQIPLHNGQHVHSLFTDKRCPNRVRIFNESSPFTLTIRLLINSVLKGIRRLVLSFSSWGGRGEEKHFLLTLNATSFTFVRNDRLSAWLVVDATSSWAKMIFVGSESEKNSVICWQSFLKTAAPFWLGQSEQPVRLTVTLALGPRTIAVNSCFEMIPTQGTIISSGWLWGCWMHEITVLLFVANESKKRPKSKPASRASCGQAATHNIQAVHWLPSTTTFRLLILNAPDGQLSIQFRHWLLLSLVLRHRCLVSVTTDDCLERKSVNGASGFIFTQ